MTNLKVAVVSKRIMRVLFVATVVKTHIMEFHIPYLKMLKEMGWETAVAARNDYENPSECVIPYCDKYYDIPFERNPIKPGNIAAYRELKTIIDDGEYDIIHCHTPVGAMLTRLASGKARRMGSKVIYTAHGFHFYKGAPILNWILYYPVERLLARKTDVLITITKEDYERATKFRCKRVEYIPGVGIDLARFMKDSSLLKAEFKSALQIPQNAIVLLSVGELNKNKNHKVVIEELKSFKNLYYVICGRGPLMEYYKKLSTDLGVSDRVKLVGYQTNVFEYYNMADVFVFPSFREGLPVALMEAMASELVCVASYNRGTNDLLEDSDLRFHPTNKKEFDEKLRLAIYEDCSVEIKRNLETVKSYDVNITLDMVKKLYLSEVE